MWPEIAPYWPLGLVAAGAMVLLYGQRDRLSEAWAWFSGLFGGSLPVPADLTRTERIEKFGELYDWLSGAGRIKAADTLESILPELVKDKLP